MGSLHPQHRLAQGWILLLQWGAVGRGLREGLGGVRVGCGPPGEAW